MMLAHWERHRFDDTALAADRDALLTSADQTAGPAARLTGLPEPELQPAGALVLTAHLDTHRPPSSNA